MAYIDKNELLKSITKEDFIKILEALGIDNYRAGKQNEIILSTALCHGGHKYKLYYYSNDDKTDQNGMFKCYTCGDSYDIIQFVIRANRSMGRNISWYKALNWIAASLGRTDEVLIDPANIKKKKNDDFSWINRIKSVMNKESEDAEEKILDETFLDVFTYLPYEDWLNDGCGIEALDRYEIGFSILENAISIPHRDIDGNLIGIRGRFLLEEDIEKGKYRPLHINAYTCKHPLGNHLFGLWVTKDYIKQIGKIVIVESEKSVILGRTYFGESSYVVATCGSSISAKQVEIIKNLNLQKVILAPDRDYHKADSFEATAWFNKQALKLEPFLLYCQTYLIADDKDRLGYQDSPLDKGKEIFLELYKEKIEITTETIREIKEENKHGRKNING